MSVFPSNSIPIFILLCFTILFHIPNVTAADEEDPLIRQCFGDYYGPGSVYQTNRNNLLDYLVSKGSREGYSKYYWGDQDRVYGLAQCRGDVLMENCQTCLTTAKDLIIQKCVQMSVTLLYDRCMLRYSPYTISLDTSVINFQANCEPPVEEGFGNEKRDWLMGNLQDNAGFTPTRYSSGQSDEHAPSQVMYGAAQCTRDLSQKDCLNCLYQANGEVHTKCSASGGTGYSPSCYVKYLPENFVESSSQSPTVVAPTSSPGSSPPPPPSRNDGNDGGKSFNVLNIIVAIIASIMLQ